MKLNDLLAVDSSAPTDSIERLARFDPSLPPLFQMALEMFGLFDGSMKAAFDEIVSEDSEVLRQQAEVLGITGEELDRALSTGKGVTQGHCMARPAYLRRRASFARATIFWLLNRQFLWGLTDLLRMRLIAADGYRRLEAESIGLLLTIQADPSVGDRWLRVKTLDEGKEFFRDTQGSVKESIRQVDLAFIYDHGSAVAQHVRIASGVLGLSFASDSIELQYLDVRDEDPFSHILAVVSFLTTQIKVFLALSQAFPEVKDAMWIERVRSFTEDVRHLWQRLDAQFPEQSREARKEVPDAFSEGTP